MLRAACLHLAADSTEGAHCTLLTHCCAVYICIKVCRLLQASYQPRATSVQGACHLRSAVALNQQVEASRTAAVVLKLSFLTCSLAPV